MAERHAEDIRRAHDMAKIRKEKEAKADREAIEQWEKETQGKKPSQTAPKLRAPKVPAPRMPLAAIEKENY